MTNMNYDWSKFAAFCLRAELEERVSEYYARIKAEEDREAQEEGEEVNGE